MAYDLMCNRFHHDLDDRDGMIEAYLRHDDAVRAEVPPGRLIDWTAADGWEPLCAGLGLPVPDEPFPHVNSTDGFLRATGAAHPD